MSASKTKLTRSEREIEQDILVWLNFQQGCKAWKNKSTGTYDPVKGIFRRSYSKFSEKGSSDILGIYRGKMICIEVKSAKGKLRPEQLEFLTTMQKLGAIAFVARSLEDVTTVFAASFGTKSSGQSGLC